MELSQPSDAKIDSLRQRLEGGDLRGFEDLWIDVVESPEAVPLAPSLIGLGRELIASGEVSRAETLLDLLLAALDSSAEAPAEPRLEVQRLLLRCRPNDRELRRKLVDLFEQTYGPTTAERVYLEASGLRDTADARRAAERLDRLLRFVPGACVFHESGWGLGEILEVDPLLKQVRVDLEQKKDHRIAIDAIDSILRVIPDDGFLALRYRGGEELRRLASEEPAALVEKVLDAFGNPLALKDLKAHLVPSVIESSGWARWWNSAKVRLRETGYFRVGDRAPYKVEKLARRTSYDQDLHYQFESGGWNVKRQVARQVLRGGASKYPTAYLAVREELVRLATDPRYAADAARVGHTSHRSNPTDVAERRLVAAVLLRRADETPKEATLEQVLSELEPALALEVAETFNQPEDLRSLLEAIEATWPDRARELHRQAHLSRGDALREAVLRWLEERQPSYLAELLDELIRAPRLSPEALSWHAEQRLKGAPMGPFASLSDQEFLVLILDVLEHVMDRSARLGASGTKDVLRRLESLLFHKKGSFFRATIEGLSIQVLRDIHRRLVAASDSLARHGTRLLEILSIAAPAISADERDEYVWWDPQGIYVTERGFSRRREEFRQLTEEKLPAVFEAIGRAREFGDLSENAEYTSALEERDHLTKRATAIDEELKRARIIRPEDVRSNRRVSLGHQVRLRDLDSGEETTFAILGPWDGSPEEGVISYLSPLGHILLGRRVNEEFDAELPGGSKRYKILEVRSSFDAK